MIKRAMILAAGKGTRLKPLTDTCPKPLIKVAGISLLDRIIKKLHDHGIHEIIVNTYYLAEAFLTQPHAASVTIIKEDMLLETGGGIKNALSFFKHEPFFVINGDALWQDLDQTPTCLTLLEQAWNPDIMDGLLALKDKSTIFGMEAAKGDFILAAHHQLRRPQTGETCPWVFIGIQILKPHLFHHVSASAFSNNLIYNAAIAQQRLFGIPLSMPWYHISTIKDLQHADKALQNN